MKAFIFVALVASVAARSLDLETLRLASKDKTLLNTNKVVGDDLLKEQQLNKKFVIGQENLVDTTVFPVQDKTVQGIYNYDNVVDVDRVLTIEELYSTEIFKEYLTLPMFRQYIQYPSFQRFVGSVYFQRFYQLPAYKQYFVNPVLFYKYVYPIVQLFNTEYTLPSVYGQHEDVLGLQTLVDNVLLKNKNFLPYAYNYNRFTVPTTAFQGYQKLSKTLYNQQPITQIKTDVKLTPEKVVVEPITHQQIVVEEPKIVDVQVDQKIAPVVDSDSVVPVTSVVLTEHQLVILKDVLQKNIITPEVYQAVVVGKIDFTTIIRQVLERRGFSVELINLFINRLVDVDSVYPTLSEKDVLLVNELLRQHFITSEVYQAVLVGKFDFFTLLRQIIFRRDVIDTVYPIVDKPKQLLKQLLQQNIISQDIYEAVILGKVDFVTILRQVLERRGFTSDLISLIINRLVVVDSEVTTTQLLNELLRQHLISSEIYQAVVFGKIDIYTVLRQIIFRRDVIDTVVPYTNVNRYDVDRFVGNDRFDLINKFYGYKNLYNTEIPTFRDNVYNRYPIVA